MLVYCLYPAILVSIRGCGGGQMCIGYALSAARRCWGVASVASRHCLDRRRRTFDVADRPVEIFSDGILVFAKCCAAALG